MQDKIMIYDTTLRDGAQMKGINFSLEDKLRIIQKLDELGIDYCEGGWPFSNPTDEEFFKEVRKLNLKHIKVSAFGSTCRAGNEPQEDMNLIKLVEAKPDTINIFGKSWDRDIENALGISLEKNLEIIEGSLKYLKQHCNEVMYIGEHFFDGYKANKEYAVKTLKAAERGGADVLVLADTNGGCTFFEIRDIINEVKEMTSIPLGIHAHNDSGMAVANTLQAVDCGVHHIQGTMNGYGERAGNANLSEILPNLELKLGLDVLGKGKIEKLTSISRFISEIANVAHPDNMPYVGAGVFAHKAGVHVNAIMKDAKIYEHEEPEVIGNKRKILISDMAGRSNIVYKANELGIKLEKNDPVVKDVIDQIKELEGQGYEFDGADGSFELMLRKAMKTRKYFFDLEHFRLIIERTKKQDMVSEAAVKVILDGSGEQSHTVAETGGPVNALDAALRKALKNEYPQLDNIELIDYKVRVLNGGVGTDAKVRVLIETLDKTNGEKWGTVGVSENIINASWEALIDSFEYYLHRI